MGKEIVVEPVTRLEGHNTLKVKLGDDGTVQDVQFSITSTRFFEKFLELLAQIMNFLGYLFNNAFWILLFFCVYV